MTFTINFLLIFAIALAVSSIGFFKYVYFISLGYGFSIAVIGIALIFMFQNTINALGLVSCILFIVYGLRLSLFLLVREIRSSAYNSAMKKEIKQNKDVTFGVKIVIWLTCVILYGCQVSPFFFRFQNNMMIWDSFLVLGLFIATFGLVLESIADIQKNYYKKQKPDRFCDKGLYKIVRCPNYFGEVLFWTGVFVSSVNCLSGVWQWIIAAIGYAGIVYVMFSGARRLELRQNRNYGEDSEYQEYVKRTPILLPLVPLYSVAKCKWLVG